MRFLFILFLFLTNPLLYAFPNLVEGPKKQEAEIRTAPTHIVILSTDASSVFGVYYTAVQNETKQEQDFTTTIRLPRETLDFQAGDGLTNENISIVDDGVLKIRKKYPPGLSLQAVQFIVPVKKDTKNVLTFVPAENIDALFFATPQSDLLKFSAVGFEDGVPPMLLGGHYSGVNAKNIAAGRSVELMITGFPGGRLNFFILGACMGLLLILSAAILTRRTYREEGVET
jgi:hypothetical protein